jgi:hypothetical protein
MLILPGNNLEFLGDDLLDYVIEELEDDWYKIFVMSGIAFSEIEESILQSRQTTQVKKQVHPDITFNFQPINR